MDIKFDKSGLIPAVIQDADTREVLMVAWMNEESFRKSLEIGETVFFSRSRNKLWHKGESSGHTQKIKEILTDCDHDCLVIYVKSEGPACHEGFRSCFVNQLGDQGTIEKVTMERLKDPKDIYG